MSHIRGTLISTPIPAQQLTLLQSRAAISEVVQLTESIVNLAVLATTPGAAVIFELLFVQIGTQSIALIAKR